jgi:hypothetical protein
MSIYFMHYNFVRIHQTLRCTPAMAAGVTETLWDVALKLLEAYARSAAAAELEERVAALEIRIAGA